MVYTINTQIDFEDIDKPLISSFKMTTHLEYDPSATTTAKMILLKKQVFYDNVDQLQLVDGV